MKEVDLGITLKDLDGESVKDANNKGEFIMLNKLAANLMMSANGKNNPVRMLEIATSLYRAKGAIQLEDNDFNILKETINKSEGTVLVKGQILKALENAEEKK